MGDYLTLAEVHEQATDLGTDYDVFIGKLITRASRDIDRLTGQFFDTKAGVTNLFDGTGGRALFLPKAWPLISVTTLQTAPSTGGTLAAIPSTDFFLEPTNRPTGAPATWIELTNIPYRFFAYGKRNVSVLGDWGWTVTPDEIKEVTLEFVVRGWRMRGSGDADIAGLTGLDTETIPRWLSPRSLSILKHYGYKQEWGLL